MVLGAVFAAAWISRRLRGFGPARGQHLTVLAQLPLGSRERAVLIRVGAQRLLLGVAAGSVRTLHVLADAPTGEDGEAAAASTICSGASTSPSRPSFRELLLKSLGK